MVHFLVIRVSCLSSEIGERSGVEGREGDGEGGWPLLLLAVRPRCCSPPSFSHPPSDK